MSCLSKLEAFRQLAEEISKCRKCSLSETRRNPVLGDGDINSTLVLIGEAPGYWEDIRGKPFVGSAGRLLNEILEKTGISREKVYITNIVKCRPPGNRDPRPDEIEACRDYLDKQLDLIGPKIIVTLGRHSTAYIFLRANMIFRSISEVHGRIFEIDLFGKKVYLIPSYHPAAALYNKRLRINIEKALFLAKDLMEMLR